MESTSQKVLQIGSILFSLAGVVYLLCEAISAYAWSNPSYQYAINYISDLGIPVVTQFMGRTINSPLYFVMNFGFFANGILFAIAYFMIMSALPTKRKMIGLAITVIYTIGIIMVGMFPGYDWWGEPFHGLGAMLAIVGGNLAILCGGLMSHRIIPQKWVSTLSVIFCIAGIISFALFLGINNNRYAAVFERMSVYTIMVWCIIFGLFVQVKSRRMNVLNDARNIKV
ncbi:hypothetical protein AMQ84_25970 [Paenibacillus riograndensis]|uniref:DUF998 domain-containing protein n=1 Tax=Paenibacillus riograndensis TaxID=483937 RepID=A0A132TLC2_9BACL|nr:DUF998 domain-containing protein [Paenibacillus riograndensis]KWX72135.1 hypothetical protein AMQ84_25970 [Paenibacillus riograndensis]